MIKIAICDDEVSARATLCSLLECYRMQKMPDLQNTGFSNGFSLLDAVDCGERFDIAILDILMPGENGMHIAKELRKNNSETEIIFLSSTPEYAVESYEVKANNYLLKPLSEDRFFTVLDNCIETISQKHTASFIIRSGTNSYTRILYSKFVYGEAMRKTVNLHLSDHTVVSSVMTFTELTNLLNANPDFVKPHRSYIVNMHYIKSITKSELILATGDRISIPRNHYTEVSEKFFDFAFSHSFG